MTVSTGFFKDNSLIERSTYGFLKESRFNESMKPARNTRSKAVKFLPSIDQDINEE